MAVTTDPVRQELERLISQARLVAGDTSLAPGERFTASVLVLPSSLPTAPTATVAWSVSSAADGAPLSPGVAFLAPRGLAGTQVELVFRPEVIERLAQPGLPLRRRVRATLTLTATSLEDPAPVSVSRDFETEVTVLPLQIPSVLALFRHRNFDFRRAGDPQEGAALVVVPANSPLTSLAAVKLAVTDLVAGVQGLGGFARFATLAAGLGELSRGLSIHPADHVQLRRTDAIANLNAITLIERAFLANDTEAEDELSSLILLGPATRRARCFVRRNLDPTAGRLDVTVGDENAVLIRSLHAREPATVPAGSANVVVAPPGARTFGDELSSVQLLPPQGLSTMDGRATLEINSELAGRDTEPISVGLAFAADHRTFVVDSFPPIEGDKATITLDGEASGTFDPGTGAMTLNVRLHLAAGLGGEFEIPFALTTGTDSEGIFTVTGDPLDLDTGAVTLVGASRVEESALFGGKEAKLVVEATLDPIP